MNCSSRDGCYHANMESHEKSLCDGGNTILVEYFMTTVPCFYLYCCRTVCGSAFSWFSYEDQLDCKMGSPGAFECFAADISVFHMVQCRKFGLCNPISKYCCSLCVALTKRLISCMKSISFQSACMSSDIDAHRLANQTAYRPLSRFVDIALVLVATFCSKIIGI